MRRLKDKADVVELMKRRQLPRNWPVQPAGPVLYEQTRDALPAEK